MRPSNQGRRAVAPAGSRERASRTQGERERIRARKLTSLVRYRDDHGATRPMTGVDDAQRTNGLSPGARISRRLIRPLRPYVEIFRIPGARRFSAAAVIGRMPMSMFGLGTVLLIAGTTGRYGMAGAVAVIATVQLRLPTWAFFVPGAVAGAAMPGLGTMVRARWSVLLAGSSRLHAAFSFESVADELCFVIGPAAVTLLATEVFPAAGVGAAALLCVVGTLWFAAQRGTEPVIVRPEAPAGSPDLRTSRASRAPRVRG